MKEKMAKKLKELYSNLGLPECVISSVAAAVVVGLAADADDAAIEARAKESSVEDMLKSFQSHADKIRTDANKPKDKPKGDDKPKEEPGKDNQMPDWVKEMLAEQKKTNDALIARIGALEQTNATSTFEATVDKIAKELNLSGAVLDLCKQGLSSDMKESDIRDKLGAAKKTLIENGVRIEEGVRNTGGGRAETEAERKEAEEWAKAHAIQSEGE